MQKKEIKPVFDDHCPRPCKKCGHVNMPNLSNTPPGMIMNYMLSTHASYLRGAVIKNIDFLNSIFDASGKILRAEDE